MRGKGPGGTGEMSPVVESVAGGGGNTSAATTAVEPGDGGDTSAAKKQAKHAALAAAAVQQAVKVRVEEGAAAREAAEAAAREEVEAAARAAARQSETVKAAAPKPPGRDAPDGNGEEKAEATATATAERKAAEAAREAAEAAAKARAEREEVEAAARAAAADDGAGEAGGGSALAGSKGGKEPEPSVRGGTDGDGEEEAEATETATAEREAARAAQEAAEAAAAAEAKARATREAAEAAKATAEREAAEAAAAATAAAEREEVAAARAAAAKAAAAPADGEEHTLPRRRFMICGSHEWRERFDKYTDPEKPEEKKKLEEAMGRAFQSKEDAAAATVPKVAIAKSEDGQYMTITLTTPQGEREGIQIKILSGKEKTKLNLMPTVTRITDKGGEDQVRAILVCLKVVIGASGAKIHLPDSFTKYSDDEKVLLLEIITNEGMLSMINEDQLKELVEDCGDIEEKKARDAAEKKSAAEEVLNLPKSFAVAAEPTEAEESRSSGLQKKPSTTGLFSDRAEEESGVPGAVIGPALVGAPVLA